MIIYLDMDDVVADWYTYAQDYLDIRWDKADNWHIPDSSWKRLKDCHRFYRDLPLKAGANELVEWVTDYAGRSGNEVRFLSALPHNNDMHWAVWDKVQWAQRYFPNIPVFLGPYSHDKQHHCKPGDILIDDRAINCEQWEAVGGLAHIYDNWEDCKAWLEKTLP
jgi:5'(3')-deoxyribonucleotidase